MVQYVNTIKLQVWQEVAMLNYATLKNSQCMASSYDVALCQHYNTR